MSKPPKYDTCGCGKAKLATAQTCHPCSVKSLRKPETCLDRFAELLSRGISPPDAAECMGKPRERGASYLTQIRKKLGWQAQ